MNPTSTKTATRVSFVMARLHEDEEQEQQHDQCAARDTDDYEITALEIGGLFVLLLALCVVPRICRVGLWRSDLHGLDSGRGGVRVGSRWSGRESKARSECKITKQHEFPPNRLKGEVASNGPSAR